MKSNKRNMAGDKQQHSGRRQRCQPGFGRGLKSLEEADNWQQSDKTGVCRNTRTTMASSQPVIGAGRTSGSINLQLLKEQAERLTSALEDIQRQIKMFEHH